ncbi:MAG: hybrid sensor histidine kinase/response regulator [Granulosicoccus sp.]
MSTANTREIDSRLAQFNLLASNLVWIIPASVFAALILALATGDQLSLQFRTLWFGVVFIMQLVRSIVLFRWLRDSTTADNVQERLHLATVFSTITGCCFGLFGYLAISLETPLVSLLVFMLLTGMVATATATVSYLRTMYTLYVIPLMLPIGIRMFSLDAQDSAWIGGLVLLYLFVSYGSSRTIRASIIRSINLRFDNVELLDDLKHQHQRAEVALAREEKANLAKSRFLAAASHDLRQPLHSLRLFTATLEMQTRNTQHKTLVNQINSSVKSLEELFNALLDISKLDAGTIVADRQHVYIDTLLTQIEGEFKPLALEKDLEFTVETSRAVVLTDPLLLERLMRNLVGNAIRYTQSGNVYISTEYANDRIWVSVKDSGVGIPIADQNRIFEEFVQLGNAERDRDQGIGLGLSIVKRVADILDIELHVSSVVGEGATFSVGVPEGDESQCRFRQVPEQMAPDHVPTLFILVIDDEEEVCLAIEGLLETWGCVVMCATSGDAAIQQLFEIGDIPDLIISDYRLRDGETGGDAIVNIRKAFGTDLPAIILSGDIAPDRLQDIKALGFPFLHKPCEPETLRQLISRETRPVNQLTRDAV